MQVHVARPAVAARVTLADAVREGAATGLHEILRSRTVPVVGIVAIPGHTPAPAHLVTIPFALTLIAGIEGCRLGLALSLVIATASSTTSREVSVVHIVGIRHDGIAHSSEGFHGRQTETVAIVGTIAEVGISLYAIAGAALGDELECEVVITIVDTRHSRQVTFIVVGLHLIDHIRRQVLHHGVVVARHEVTTVELELAHFLTVDADLAVVVDLRTGERLHQSLNHRTFRHTEGIGVIDYRIVADHHLRQIGGDDSLVELHGAGFHRDGAYGEVPAPLLVESTIVVLVTEEGDFHQILTCRHIIKCKAAVVVRERTAHECRVEFAGCFLCQTIKLDGTLWHGRVVFFVDNAA